MAKKNSQTGNKAFKIDIDSLLMSDFLEESEKDNDASSPELWKQAKKSKIENPSKSRIKSNTKEENDDGGIKEKKRKNNQDVSQFFENVGNDFNKSMHMKKERLTKFTKMVASVYQNKITEMVKKQEGELEDFKKQTILDVKRKLNQFEEEFQKLQQQEIKLTKILEQQIKLIQKTTIIQKQWIDNLTDLHENFVQAYEKLRTKHKSETLDLTKSISEVISNMQNNFLMESKKKEMKSMKTYLNSFYF